MAISTARPVAAAQSYEPVLAGIPSVRRDHRTTCTARHHNPAT